MLLGKFVFVAEEQRWSHYLFQVNYAMNLFFMTTLFLTGTCHFFDYFCRRQIFFSESFFSTLLSPLLLHQLPNKLAGILYEAIYFS